MKLTLKEIRQYGNLEFLARQLVEGFITGLHKSPYHGFSVEFAEHRLYNSGESTRYIDWKVYAKTDRLYTKRYEEETNLRCQLVLDVSSSMYYPQSDYGKITFSIMSAAALAYLLQQQRDAVGLTTFASDIEQQTQIKSTPGHLHSIFLILEKLLSEIPKEKKTSVASVIDQIAEKNHKRSLVILFSDMFETYTREDELFSALQHLKHNKHEVLLFHVTDPITEEYFNFEERPYQFVDIETGEKIKIQPSMVRETFQRSMREMLNRLKLKCHQYKIDFIEADINKGFSAVLTSYLIKRAKMK
ncbi:MAG: DUF58 domain-containing protein [Cytophagaceae bacterium]|nr:DUF58 domain-containing protein [Cytophagaceae bacterium]MDW8455196.1 DUF58 domain-containing protein [Cytophagaceae bacterium]